MADLSFQMALCRSPGHGREVGSQEITVTSRFRATNYEHHRRTSVKPTASNLSRAATTTSRQLNAGAVVASVLT